jgi:hypothetical protein
MKIIQEDSQISEFLRVGYAKSNALLLHKLRRRKNIEWRVFSCKSGKKGRGIYSMIDFIGKYNKYYFVVGMEENLVQHLTKLFNLKNPNASSSMKRSFNYTLRDNYLINTKRCVFKESMQNKISRGVDSTMIITDDEVEKIKSLILECIEDWQTKKDRNPLSWVDDRLWMMIVKDMPDKLSECDFTYRIHEAWINDWNISDRKIPMDDFLETWATNENIRNAVKNYRKI